MDVDDMKAIRNAFIKNAGNQQAKVVALNDGRQVLSSRRSYQKGKYTKSEHLLAWIMVNS